MLHFVFPVSAGISNLFTDLTVTFPDGFYSTTDNNNF